MKRFAAAAALVAVFAWPTPSLAIDVLTYHYNNLRTGWNASETMLTPAAVGSAALQLAFDVKIAGLSFTQPLIATAERTARGRHDLVIVGTGQDMLYAFNAESGRPIWRVSLAPPGTSAVPQSFTGCPNLPTAGITSTPVIDRTLDTVFVVAETLEGSSQQTIHFRLHAIALGTGKDRQTPVDVAATAGTGLTFDPQVQTQRPALTEANGQIYVTFGGSCDYNAALYHGWVLAYNTSSLALAGVFVDTPVADRLGNFQGGIWMSGNGPAVDGLGNLFLLSGNGSFDGKRSFGDSAIALPPSLSRVLDFFTPDTVNSDNANDADFGSGGLMLFPDLPKSSGGGDPLAAGQGKDGVLTLMDRLHLGGFHPGKDRVLAELSLGGVWSSPAYFDDTSAGEFMFVTGGPLYAVHVVRRPVSMTVTAQTSDQFPMDNGNGATATISSNGPNISTAVIWIVQWSNGEIQLLAYPASNLSQHIFAYPLGRWVFTQVNNTMIPTVANGYVYVAGANHLVALTLHS